MLQFKRDPSGLYLASDQNTARVAFLFQDQTQTPATFDLTATSWSTTVGYLAFFAPSTTRNWNNFATGVRAAFVQTQNAGPQIGWFPEPLAAATTVIAVLDSGAPPTLSNSFNLVFLNTTCVVMPEQFGGSSNVAFDDGSNSLMMSGLTSVMLQVTLPAGGGTVQFPAQGLPVVTTLLVPLTGPLAGVATFSVQIAANSLSQFEAGMMFFSQETGKLVAALNYPAIRAPIGSSAPFNFNVSLDMVAPTDPARSFFQFADPLLGSYFVTATGKPFAFNTVGGANLATMSEADILKSSRLVFAGRPVSDPTDIKDYYLTPAGQFGLTLDGGGNNLQTTAQSAVAQMLCGITGTEFLSVGVGATPDALEFVPGEAAWRMTVDPSSTAPVFLDKTATTSWAQVVTASGAYISQPERSPLFSPSANGVRATSSGLSVHVLDFDPTNAWQPSDGAAPPAPLVPYAGLDFATNPNIDLGQYLAMERGGLNPTRANAFVGAPAIHARGLRALVAAPAKLAMTPQGMLVGLKGTPAVWDSLQIAVSNAITPILEFDSMGPAIRKAVQKNQIFTVVSVNPADAGTGKSSDPLFTFDNRYLEISDWTFDLSPAGLAAPDATPPIFIMKFYPGKSINDLVGALSLWSDPTTFNAKPTLIQAYLTKVIAAAKADLDKNGENSLYYNFYQTVTDPAFSGILAVNCNMRLDLLPPPIRAVLGGMEDPGIAGFRVHHVGVSINDIDPGKTELTLSQSAMFALVDYEWNPVAPKSPYDFQVEYLRALFTNSELRSFSCKINLTIDNLFKTAVTLQPDGGVSTGKNLVVIMGSYQAHKTSGDDKTSGQGVYSFISTRKFEFDFGKNTYLKSIALTKLQFSFDQEEVGTPVDHGTYTTTTNPIKAHFGIWGSIKFNDLKVLDIFSFDQLVFSDLGITAGFDLILNQAIGNNVAPPPSTSPVTLTFAPGNLRLDLGATVARSNADSLLNLLPFKLKSFLYSENANESIESLNYYSLGSIQGLSDNGIGPPQNYFNYALLFDLDLGSMGGLVGSLSAFKFSILIGWLAGDNGGIAFGIQLPQVNGKLEIKIEGVLTISIKQFNLEYATDPPPSMLVLGMQDCYIEVLGKRLPPEGTISLGLFAPSAGAAQIGWIGAYNKGQDGGGGGKDSPKLIAADKGDGNGKGDGGSKVFDLDYLGVGQRVGPDPKKPPTDFDAFLKYMKGDFWDKLTKKQYADIYHPDGKWIIITHFTLLEKIEIGFVFYDVTPFYSLLLRIKAGKSFKGFEFEITYTKVTDTIGLFAAKIALPDSLRTFEVGAASVTMPTIGIDVYTNGNWKLDLGFPDGDNWSVCFRVQAMAGPIPVTGSGGFYIASLSSATDPDVFVGKDYSSILAFGLAARLGVGKDFTAGPLKAGVSLTFFGIIQGAVGYLSGGGTDLFVKEPDALSLQGQFGIIGEIYGSIDFVIIKASVNVRIEASVGVVLMFEPHISDGSVLLYVQASVSVSVSVSIDCGLFSIDISFSYDATFRFDWQLAGQTSASHARMMFVAQIAATRRLLVAPQQVALCPNLPAALPLIYLAEFTVVFPDSATVGAPWLVTSLGIPYDNAPSANPSYADFKPFEAVTTQLATFALIHALNLPAYNSIVPLVGPDQNTLGLKDIDSKPELLTGWIDYPTLLSQLALFQGTIQVPKKNPNDPNGTVYHATTFPMPPFLALATKGRLGADGAAEDFGYQFLAKNPVSADYLQAVDEYFNKMFVNRTSDSSHEATFRARAADDTKTPLGQEIFLDYFKGLIRGAVHELLVTLQNSGDTQAPLDKLFMGAVGAQRIRALAGQMASTLRGGVRLPYTDGLTVPDGQALPTTNPLFALLWQEFPVGGFANKSSYTVALSNPDGSQKWLKPDPTNATFTITNDSDVYGVAPYQNLHESDVAKPSAPTPIPLTQTGPQAFAFQNPIVWTPPSPAKPMSLRPFPPNLTRLQSAQGGPFEVTVKSRRTGGAYLPQGNSVAPADIVFATTVNLTIKQIPGVQKGSVLTDVYALSGASQADEALLGQILAVLKPPSANRPIAAIQILYPPDPAQPGLVSATVNPTDVFVLRTNTTSVSQPPQGLMAEAVTIPDSVAVGADLDLSGDGGYGFLQIVQQATVTNAPGYLLRYIDAAGNSLGNLFAKPGPATVTLVITYAAGVGTSSLQDPKCTIQPYYNSIVLSNLTAAQLKLLYYAETVAPALDTRYVALAAGTAGVELARPESVMHLKPSPALAAAARTANVAAPTRTQMIKALVAAGVTDRDHIRKLLVESGSAPASLNALYSIVTYQIQKTAGFALSNLSAPLQPQKATSADTTGYYRIVAPLYSVADANIGVPVPNRYASINDPFGLSIFVNDAFGNQLPTPITHSGTNYYFDPILPLDQWQGIVPTYDFVNPQPGVVSLHLTPSQTAFAGITQDQIDAALVHYGAIEDQITGPGISFFVETNLALQPDNTSLVAIPLSQADTTNVIGMVAGMIAWLKDPKHAAFPAAVDISVAVSGPGTLPPLFDIAVLFGIERDRNLVAPEIRDIFPPAQTVATSIVPGIVPTNGVNGNTGMNFIGIFAKNFMVAFPAMKLAVGMNGGAAAPVHQSKTALARKRLKARGLAGDGSGGSRLGEQSIWAVAANLLDISIGTSAGTGPRFLSPKPLDNTLNSDTVPLPDINSVLGKLPAQQLFIDVDLDQLNRVFFQAVDNVLSPASAAKAFELDSSRAAYDAIARGRESLAQKYATFEVDWLFPAGSPFTGTAVQFGNAREAFEQQMRAALMTAYSVDTIVQYDVAWNKQVSAAADGYIELFGKVEAVLNGSYVFNGTNLDVTTATPHGLSKASPVELYITFAAQAGSTAPANGIYSAMGGTDTTFTISNVTTGSGPGTLSATLQNSGLSTARVAVSSKGPSPLTFMFGNPDVASAATVSFDLRYGVTNLQYFLAPDTGTPGEARPSIWLQLVDPLQQHIGPDRTLTEIPVVFRQYPTPPTLINQSWTKPPAGPPSANPLADESVWDYVFTYQAMLAAQDQINSAITYNTDLRPPPANNKLRALDASGVVRYSLFQALARFSAVYGVIQGILPTLTDARWGAAIGAFADSIGEVVANTDWTFLPSLDANQGLVKITDRYVITQQQIDQTTRLITLQWPLKQGQSHFQNVTLSVQALDPKTTSFPNLASAYPNQGPVSQPPANSSEFQVKDAPPDGLGAAHRVEVHGLSVLAAENTIAAVQVERNLITLNGSDGTPYQVVPEFVYTTAEVRPSQPVTPFIDNVPPPYINVASLGQGSPASLSQHVLTVMTDLLADPVQSASLLKAHQAAGVTTGTTRRVKVGCSYQFPIAAVAGGTDASINPLVPVVLARSFDIDGHDSGQLGDFATLFSDAIADWANDKGVVFGANATPAGASLVFDITLYAGLSGGNVPVLRFENLRLNLTDIKPA
jgi:hypothetical protein